MESKYLLIFYQELLNKCFGSVEGVGKEEKKTKKDD